MMNPIEAISLYYSEGHSDKEYHAEIVEIGTGNVVNFRFGRRGTALTVGTKTSIPVDFTQAKMIFDKLVKEKMAKGYTPALSGAAYQGTAQAGLKTDFAPQLLNSLTEAEANALIDDDQWAAQEKMDGERRAAHAENGTVIGINRKGLIVPLPDAIVAELQSIAVQSGAIRVDGEMIGDRLYVFDLHIFHGKSIHDMPWLKRMRLAQFVLAPYERITMVPIAITATEKRNLWTQVLAAHGEGVVFKRGDGSVKAGRPNSGGDWLKFKFTESASCCVMAVNAGKRSVKIGLLDNRDGHNETRGQMMIPVGNVTIPPNYGMPVIGEIVEVNYLYAYQGGSLYQPVYRGKRMDVDISVCSLDQLKYKPEIQDGNDRPTD